MKLKVTEEGVLIAKQLLEGIEEVEIRQQQDLLIVVPISNEDPILQLGKQPIIDDSIDDASSDRDRYLYGA